MLRNAFTPWLFAALFTSSLAACGDGAVDGLSGTPEDTESSQRNFDVSGVEMGVTAGVSGTVWVLDKYSDGSSHPGQNAIDIGTAGGTGVWHQVNGVPAEVGGGWIFVDFVQEAGFCSGFNPGDANYNGAKLRVYTYFYAIDGSYLGYHVAAYQHVEPAEGVKDQWFTWNHAGAGTMWATPGAALGNGADGGLRLGALFSGGGKKILNTNGKLCHWGDHLHQEGAGSRAALSLDQGVSGRGDRAHAFYVTAGMGAGNPPSAPPPVSGAPANPPEDPPQDPPADPPKDPPVDPGDPSLCACKTGVDNFCFYAPKTAGCDMTFPGGYCDPNGDGDYSDGNWETGWYDFHDKCSG
jgi:hypothetical protein